MTPRESLTHTIWQSDISLYHGNQDKQVGICLKWWNFVGNMETSTNSPMTTLSMTSTVRPTVEALAATTAPVPQHDNPSCMEIPVYFGAHAPGGRHIQDVDDVGMCYHECIEDTTCHAFDFNSIRKTCWHHSVSSLCQELQTKPSCTHYRLSNCCKCRAYRQRCHIILLKWLHVTCRSGAGQFTLLITVFENLERFESMEWTIVVISLITPGVMCPIELTPSYYQIRKITGCACTGNARNVFPATYFEGNH